MGSILLTGSSGLIGTAIVRKFKFLNRHVIGLDIRGQPSVLMDIRDLRPDIPAISDIVGIIHLAAVSRVLDGQRNPAHCRSVNVDGMGAVIDSATHHPSKPWIIFSSSREVYGQQAKLPVREDAELNPLNHYAHSKFAAEKMLVAAQQRGLRTAIARFSNVYGDTRDHASRVVPAFARAAAEKGQLRVDGHETVLDFTHVDDVADGVIKLVAKLEGAPHVIDPVHFVSGRPTSLGDLARLAVEFGADRSAIIDAPPRSYDVGRFYGDPSRAQEFLSWSHTTELRDGFERLVHAYRAA